MIENKIKGLTLRFATERDVPIILGFIKELAVYENMIEDVKATEEKITHSIFVKKAAEAIIADYEGKPVGYALFFHNFSTFTGLEGIYLEDLFVRPKYRGKGFGKVLLSYLARLAKERGCARLEWECLDWNEPSIKFYKSLGAISKDTWTGYRLHGNALDELADEC